MIGESRAGKGFMDDICVVYWHWIALYIHSVPSSLQCISVIDASVIVHWICG